MTHRHGESCLSCDGSGVVRDFCDYDDCPDPDCTEIGHCPCRCHSDRTCSCGRYAWPRTEKGEKP